MSAEVHQFPKGRSGAERDRRGAGVGDAAPVASDYSIEQIRRSLREALDRTDKGEPLEGMVLTLAMMHFKKIRGGPRTAGVLRMSADLWDGDDGDPGPEAA